MFKYTDLSSFLAFVDLILMPLRILRSTWMFVSCGSLSFCKGIILNLVLQSIICKRESLGKLSGPRLALNTYNSGWLLLFYTLATFTIITLGLYNLHSSWKENLLLVQWSKWRENSMSHTWFLTVTSQQAWRVRKLYEWWTYWEVKRISCWQGSSEGEQKGESRIGKAQNIFSGQWNYSL
jgi:hypothetical protein